VDTIGIAGAGPGIGARAGVGVRASIGARGASDSLSWGRGTVASAPTVPPNASSPRRGAAVPQRSRRLARAVPTAGRSAALMAQMIERMFYMDKTWTAGWESH
jgi:hypothetical protein